MAVTLGTYGGMLRNVRGMHHATPEWSMDRIQGKGNSIPKPEHYGLSSTVVFIIPEETRPQWAHTATLIEDVEDLPHMRAGQ